MVTEVLSSYLNFGLCHMQANFVWSLDNQPTRKRLVHSVHFVSYFWDHGTRAGLVTEGKSAQQLRGLISAKHRQLPNTELHGRHAHVLPCFDGVKTKESL